MAKVPTTVRSLVGSLRAELAAFALQREQLLERRDLVESAPRPLPEATADVTELVRRSAEGMDPGLAGLAQSSSGFSELALMLHAAGQGPERSTFGLLCAVLPERMRDWLQALLEASYRSLPEPIDGQERRRQLDAIDREIAALDRAVAEMWWSAADDAVELPLPAIAADALLGLPAKGASP